ncbi:hypothetical protein ACIO3O_14565 [Streptomyces sp. NPDC087440]|uniref:hypothetical protein n=1 Tax=Streptomyces sp. NPDC087440 TaxID=3365790 RepID=UPI0038216E20
MTASRPATYPLSVRRARAVRHAVWTFTALTLVWAYAVVWGVRAGEAVVPKAVALAAMALAAAVSAVHLYRHTTALQTRTAHRDFRTRRA